MHPAASYFADRRAARQAVEMCLPAITEAMTRKEVGESGFLHIVVMDPALTPACASFEEAILYEYSVGDRGKWDADYAAFAQAKAKVAWQNGMDSHRVQELRPHLLRDGDTTLWGGIELDGIVVAASGANPWYDEAFSGMVAMCLRAIAKENATAARADRRLFLPGR